MTDPTTLIDELRERAEWARAELNQAAAECFERAADALAAHRLCQITPPEGARDA